MNEMETRGRPISRNTRNGPGRKRDRPPSPNNRKPTITRLNLTNTTDSKEVSKLSTRLRRRRRTRRRKHGGSPALKILQQNIAGFKTRKVELLKRLSDLKVDVAALQEVNFAGETDIPTIPGWNIETYIRKTGRKKADDNQGRGGVAVMVREGLDYKVLHTCPVPPTDNTTEWIGVRIYHDESKKGQGYTDVWNLYVPRISGSKDDTRKQNFSVSHLPSSPETIILGDVNCHGSWDDWIDPDEMGDEWDSWTQQHSFSYLNTKESHTRSDSHGKKSSPDITAVHNTCLGDMTWAPQYSRKGGSDHLPILITKTLVQQRRSRKSRKKASTRPKWAHRKADWEKFRAILEEQISKWPAEHGEWKLKELSRRYTAAIQTAALAAIPRGCGRPTPLPFWTEEIQNAHSKMEEASKAAHISDAHAEQYKQARANVDMVTKKEKEESWREYVSKLDSREDPAKIWKTIRSMDGRTIKCKAATPLQHTNSAGVVKEAITDMQKSNMLVNNYAKQSRLVKDKWADKPAVHKARRATSTQCQGCKGHHTGICSAITAAEVEFALRSIKTSKSPGPDLITNEMLKNLGETARETLLRLFNVSWLTKECPAEWKLGEIITIPKPGKDKTDPESYRPITLLSCISKAMERVVKCRLQDHCERYNLLHPAQAGFRKARSTNEQIQNLTQTIMDGLQESPSHKSIVTYVDFTKAYDKVWRTNLWGKMGDMNIPSCVTRWIKSLLADRHAYVNFNGKKSNKKRFNEGLPQGSVLAPLLWLIYINSLANELPAGVSIGSTLFADDLAIIATGKTLEECERKMQKALNVLERWTKENKVTISTSKTQCCFYTKDNHMNKGKTVPNLHLNGTKLGHNSAPKFLGVIIDQSLTFKQQAQYAAKKMSKRNKVLRCLSGRSWGQKAKQLRAVHKTYTESAADHGLGAWGTIAAPSTIDIVDKKQREAARIITGCTRDTKNDVVLCEAGLLPTNLRAKQQATIQHERTTRLPNDVPGNVTAKGYVKLRLKGKGGGEETGPLTGKIAPPREMAWWTLCQTDLAGIPKEYTATHPVSEPWTWTPTATTFNTELEGCTGKHDTEQNIRAAADLLISKMQPSDIVCYTDGSAEEGTTNGGAGSVIHLPSGEKVTLKAACGLHCSSYKAEMTAINTTLARMIDETQRESEKPTHIWILTDSLSSLQKLERGPGFQASTLGEQIWAQLQTIDRTGVPVTFQWIPSHKGIPGNEEADIAAGEARELPQEEVPIDLTTSTCIIKRKIREIWNTRLSKSPEYYKRTGGRPKTLPPNLTRKEEITLHQLRAGRSPLVASDLARYKKLPEEKRLCINGCSKKGDIDHLLLECPLYSRQRTIWLGTDPDVKTLNDEPIKILKFLKSVGRLATPDLH